VHLVLRFYQRPILLALMKRLLMFLKTPDLLGPPVQESQPLRLLVQELARQ
jgi:hypothetical protein